MKRTRFTEEQVIGVLKEAEFGAKTADLARRHGVSEATIYKWKSKYGGRVGSIDADRKSVRYRSTRDDYAALREKLRELANQRRRFGYRRLHILPNRRWSLDPSTSSREPLCMIRWRQENGCACSTSSTM